jgi:uncharacterized protein YndB with AHSA1/START domain
VKDTSLDTGPLADVDCTPADDRWTLVLVRTLRHPPEKVWAALTEPAQLREWAPFVADRNLGTPGDATLTMVDGDRTEDLPATVSLAEPPTLLEYTWGPDVLRWELEGTGGGTRLTLRHPVGEQGLVPRMAAGWHLCLAVAEHLLDGRPVGPIRGEAARDHGWDALHEAYADRLGIAPGGWPEDRRSR